jgi:hypothetical protein
MKWIKSCFTDINNKPSSKRLAGALGWISSIIMVALGGLGFFDPNVTLVSTLMFASTGLLGSTIAERKSKQDKQVIDQIEQVRKETNEARNDLSNKLQNQSRQISQLANKR